MAKLKGKAKAAFLRRMARGRAAANRRSGRGGHVRRRRTTVRRKASFSGTLRPSRRRPGVVRIQLRQNPMSALIANPGGALVPYSPAFAAYQMRRHTKKRRPSMAKRKRRKRRYARRAAPRYHRRRRRHRRAAPRRIRRAIRVPKRYAHRVYRPRGRRAVYLNPRRRRIRRRRNPSLLSGNLLKRVLVPYAAGFIASGAIAVLDTGLANYPMVKNLVKVGGAFLIAIAGRRYPTASIAAIASLAGSQGYAAGTKLAGGFIAQTPGQAMKGLGEMASGSYPEMGALLTGGMGALLTGMGDPSDPSGVVANYATAMNNMAEADDD